MRKQLIPGLPSACVCVCVCMCVCVCVCVYVCICVYCNIEFDVKVNILFPIINLVYLSPLKISMVNSSLNNTQLCRCITLN